MTEHPGQMASEAMQFISIVCECFIYKLELACGKRSL